MHPCGKVSRFILLCANIVLFIGSVGLLAVSAWSIMDSHYILVVLNDNSPFWFSIILFLLGVVTFSFSIIGCLGIVQHNKGMLVAYLILGIMLFVVTVSGGIVCYLFSEKADTMWHTDIIQKMEEYNPKTLTPITKAFDEMQIELKCCGMENSNDWVDISDLYNKSSNSFPSSCCTGGKRSQCNPHSGSTYFHTDGCKTKLIYTMQRYCIILGTVSVSFGLLLLMAVSCTIWVYMEMERNYPTKADI